MKLELKSISVWSAVKVGFFLNLVMGFIMGLLGALIFAPFLALYSSMIPAAGLDGADAGEMSAGILLIVLPLVYSIGGAIFGTIFFAIGAAVYNLIARILGGIEYDASEVRMEMPMSGYQQPGTTAPIAPYTPTPGPQYPPSGSPSPYAPPQAEPQRPIEPRPMPVPPPPPPPIDRPVERPKEEPPAPPLRPDDQTDETDKPLG